MRPLAVFLALMLLSACGERAMVAAPEGVTFQVEQERQDLKGRAMQAQVINDGTVPITVEEVEFRSTRLDEPASYHGPATIPAGTTKNLTMRMGRARCGDGIDSVLRVTYTVDGGDEQISEVIPHDRYDSIEFFMRRDCAESAVGEVKVADAFTVRGTGTKSVLEVPVTFEPAADGGTVHLDHMDGTTLLAFASHSDSAEFNHDLVPGGQPYTTTLEFIPHRCDVHVVAEDRAGTVLPVHISSEASGEALFYLHFTTDQITQIFDYLADRCGYGTVQDPLLAP